MTAKEKAEDAAAQLLIALAFVLPKGTDVNATIGKELIGFRNAVRAHALADAMEAVAGERLDDPQPCEGDEAYDKAIEDAITAIGGLQ